MKKKKSQHNTNGPTSVVMRTKALGLRAPSRVFGYHLEHLYLYILAALHSYDCDGSRSIFFLKKKIYTHKIKFAKVFIININDY